MIGAAVTDSICCAGFSCDEAASAGEDAPGAGEDAVCGWVGLAGEESL